MNAFRSQDFRSDHSEFRARGYRSAEGTIGDGRHAGTRRALLVRPVRMVRLASAVGILVLTLMIVSALVSSSDALDRTPRGPSFVTARLGGGAPELMRPTLALEARTMALFNSRRSDCQSPALHAEVWDA